MSDVPRRNGEQFRRVLAEVLQAMLTERGMTAYGLAKVCGLPEQTVRNILIGQVIPRLDTTISIETVLCADLGDISRAIRDRMRVEAQQDLEKMAAAAKKKKPK